MENLKCYFAFSNDIEDNQCYVDMLLATLKSARANTTLDLHCLYDGNKSDKLYAMLQEYNVKVQIASISFLDKLKKIYTEDYMKEKFGYIISDNSLKSRFLRMLISEYETDDYILYCDTDVLFLKDIKLSDFSKLPKYIGVCPEFEKTDNYNYFNAGIMLINVKNAKKKYEEFIDIISKGEYASIECCDQGYLNEVYKNQFDKLPLEYNWKPYWGINPNAKILHFHGLKPNSICECNVDHVQYVMMKNNDASEAYYYYWNLFCEYSNVDKDTCLNRITHTLLVNLPIYKNFNKFEKRYKKFKLLLFILFIMNIILIITIICLLLKLFR